ncbi:hypothetical protein [Streptomyces sp. NBC_00370]
MFITIPTAAHTVRLWVVDSGSLDETIGPTQPEPALLTFAGH